MTYLDKLISFHVIERENNKNFLTWTYPTIAQEHKNYILQKCFSAVDNGDFVCRRSNNVWFYILEVILSRSYAVVVLAKDFQPKKYNVLCDILARKYSQNYNPVDLVNLYLTVCTSGSCSLHENGTLYTCNYKNFESVTNIKDFIQSFDLEIILLYTAILLKRRVLLFQSNLKMLFNDLLAVTSLVPPRKVENHLYPIVENPTNLRGLSFFVAGTTNRDLIKNDNLYDLFVDLQTREITISPKAEEIMGMTKTHKEVATFLVKLSTSDLSETEVKQQIAKKTKDLTDTLQNLASVTQSGQKMVTVNDLKLKKFHPNLENFLFNLALAEDMMIL